MSRLTFFAALAAVCFNHASAQANKPLTCNFANKTQCLYTTANADWTSTSFKSMQGQVGEVISQWYSTMDPLCLNIRWKQESELANGTEFFQVLLDSTVAGQTREIYASYKMYFKQLHNKAGVYAMNAPLGASGAGQKRLHFYMKSNGKPIELTEIQVTVNEYCGFGIAYSSSSGLSLGALIGIIVAILILFALIGGAVFFMRRRRRGYAGN